MNLYMNFNNLTAEGYAAFILSIVFTIITVSFFIYFFRHKQINKVLSFVTTLVLPFITVFCWIYLLMDILKYETAFAMGIAIACAAGYTLIALAITFVVSLCMKPEYKKETNKVEETQEATQTENNEEVSADAVVVTPLLTIEEEKNVETETAEVETPVETNENVEEEVVEETEEVETPVEEEKVENNESEEFDINNFITDYLSENNDNQQ